MILNDEYGDKYEQLSMKKNEKEIHTNFSSLPFNGKIKTVNVIISTCVSVYRLLYSCISG